MTNLISRHEVLLYVVCMFYVYGELWFQSDEQNPLRAPHKASYLAL